MTNEHGDAQPRSDLYKQKRRQFLLKKLSNKQKTAIEPEVAATSNHKEKVNQIPRNINRKIGEIRYGVGPSETKTTSTKNHNKINLLQNHL